jgi:fatty acid desaturase
MKFDREIRIEKYLRSHKWIIPTATSITAIGLYAAIYLCMVGYQHNHYWTIIPAGIFAHAFLIITVHEGAHKAITRSRFDYFIMNAGAVAIFIPFYAEPFRKYHLTHHANANTIVDPLWPKFKSEMYEKRRWLYMICECIPILFTFILVTSGEKEVKNKETASLTIKQPTVRKHYLLLAILASLILIIYLMPPVGFVLGSLFILNLTGVLRHWCEHMGADNEKESNTFWFPLGMGIGNHEAHHLYPHFSWLTMMIGLNFRTKDTNPCKAIYGLLFKKDYAHYHTHDTAKKK